MTHEDFIDTAIIALAAAAPEGTPWSEVVREAHELAAERLRAKAPQAPTHTPPKGGRLAPTERVQRHAHARETVLQMVRDAPGGRYPGGLWTLSKHATCGRNAAVTACRVLLDEGVLSTGTEGGRAYLELSSDDTEKRL